MSDYRSTELCSSSCCEVLRRTAYSQLIPAGAGPRICTLQIPWANAWTTGWPEKASSNPTLIQSIHSAASSRVASLVLELITCWTYLCRPLEDDPASNKQGKAERQPETSWWRHPRQPAGMSLGISDYLHKDTVRIFKANKLQQLYPWQVSILLIGYRARLANLGHKHPA